MSATTTRGSRAGRDPTCIALFTTLRQQRGSALSVGRFLFFCLLLPSLRSNSSASMCSSRRKGRLHPCDPRRSFVQAKPLYSSEISIRHVRCSHGVSRLSAKHRSAVLALPKEVCRFTLAAPSGGPQKLGALCAPGFRHKSILVGSVTCSTGFVLFRRTKHHQSSNSPKRFPPAIYLEGDRCPQRHPRVLNLARRTHPHESHAGDEGIEKFHGRIGCSDRAAVPVFCKQRLRRHPTREIAAAWECGNGLGFYYPRRPSRGLVYPSCESSLGPRLRDVESALAAGEVRYIGCDHG